MGKRQEVHNYGNVLTATYEGYLGILLRNAKREMRFQESHEEQIESHSLLTPTEVQILQSVNEGRTNQQIGELLNIQVTTVKTHLYSIYKKLAVSSRIQAVNQAKSLKII